MNDMTPLRRRPTATAVAPALFVTAARVKGVLEAAGASNVTVLDRGHRLAAFFRLQHKEPVVWIILANSYLSSFEREAAVELGYA
jgi:hypothetical protein